MNYTEVVTWTRQEATLSSKSTDYTSAKIMQIANQQMRTVFTPLIANARAGYWLHTFTRTIGAGNPYVRLPARACPAIEQCDWSADGVYWYPLQEALESEAQDWAREAQGYNEPQAFTMRGSYMYLLNAPKVEGIQLRVKVVMKPSLIVLEQGAGLILNVDPNTRILTVNAMPIDRVTNTAVNGDCIVDVIEPRGNYELSLADGFATVLDSTHIQIASGYTVARLEAGDYLRAAGQSDWPQLPEEFHSLLGTVTAVPICRQKDMDTRAEALSAAGSSGLQRFQSHIMPRVRVDVHKPIQHQWGVNG